ncbi:GNAT family N-acetyltransferase [Actinoplanes sp. M2I2]|uniref:GNAT family N-acetyltransferase n=1 Tax=Actinoplanes sp. M2I2 TaxID=1734444 RepID=UPI00202188F0|nr:GNAT family N-acetyltransferase [Actinoplanes sp. M2I2]
MTVSVEPLTSPDLAYDIASVVAHHDCPDLPFQSRKNYRAKFTDPPPGVMFERYLGHLDGKPVGYLDLSFPQLDNLDNVELDLLVLPECRRRGVGRALWEVAVERARVNNRKHLMAASVDRHPDGGAFAEAVGAKAGLAETRSRLDVTALDEPRLAELRADAQKHAGDYRLRRWVGVPPDDIIDDVAYLESRLNADAPTGDMNWEPEKIDADRLRKDEEARERRGRRSFQAGATIGDKLVAWTWLICEVDQPVHAWQNTTLVDPDHRGHRLGMLVKLDNLDNIREHRPQLEAIDTFNASENAYMLNINRAMGFRAVDAWIEWQKDL